MRRVARSLLAALVVGLSLGACDNGSVTPVDPSTLPADTTLLPPSRAPEETFTGSISQLSGTNFHSFNVNTTSDLYVAIPVVTPSVMISVGLGSPTSNGCNLGFLKAVSAGPDFVIRQLGAVAGPYCIAIEDGGRVAPFSYTAQVWHQ